MRNYLDVEPKMSSVGYPVLLCSWSQCGPPVGALTPQFGDQLLLTAASCRRDVTQTVTWTAGSAGNLGITRLIIISFSLLPCVCAAPRRLVGPSDRCIYTRSRWGAVGCLSPTRRLPGCRFGLLAASVCFCFHAFLQQMFSFNCWLHHGTVGFFSPRSCVFRVLLLLNSSRLYAPVQL